MTTEMNSVPDHRRPPAPFDGLIAESIAKPAEELFRACVRIGESPSNMLGTLAGTYVGGLPVSEELMDEALEDFLQ